MVRLLPALVGLAATTTPAAGFVAPVPASRARAAASTSTNRAGGVSTTPLRSPEAAPRTSLPPLQVSR
eukprot:7920-Eustigmatos_ZCMA.PRE.1